jgi:hypothetical protein
MAPLWRLLGYCAHRASVSLHGMAVQWIDSDCALIPQVPVIWVHTHDCPCCAGSGKMRYGSDSEGCSDCMGTGRDIVEVTLRDVAPRLVAIIGWAREKFARNESASGNRAQRRTV